MYHTISRISFLWNKTKKREAAVRRNEKEGWGDKERLSGFQCVKKTLPAPHFAVFLIKSGIE